MSTRLVGYQPQYFPRLHYYARFLNADIFKISDNLQFVRRHAYPSDDNKPSNGPSFQAHTPVKTSQGVYLLDIPTRHTLPHDERMMNTVELDYESEWPRKHLRILELNYAKAPNFKALMPSLADLLGHRYENLAACTATSILWGLSILFDVPLVFLESAPLEIGAIVSAHGFRLKRIVRMSDEHLAPAKKSEGETVNDWIVDQCRIFGATEYYLGGTAASAYIDEDRIAAAGIHLVQQEWQCDEYSQQFPKLGFSPNLSIIDLLMNVPPEEARRILMTRNQ